MFFVFFFKQKTAYEMRISDWSSDVCSSDLTGSTTRKAVKIARHAIPVRGLGVQPTLLIGSPVPVRQSNNPATAPMAIRPIWAAGTATMSISAADTIPIAILGTSGVSLRSEEHTSELQSLMRISYAVFCLQKKKGRRS